MHIAVMIGSVRDGSNTGKAATVIVAALKDNAAVTVDIINPRQLALAIPGAPGQEAAAEALTVSMQTRIKAVDGVIMVTPEYDGTYSAVLKLMIEYLGYPSVLAGKPVAVLGVAAGRIGALKALEHLRSLLIHIGALVVPMPQSIAEAHRVFDADGKVLDPHAETAMRVVAASLVAFIEKSA